MQLHASSLERYSRMCSGFVFVPVVLELKFGLCIESDHGFMCLHADDNPNRAVVAPCPEPRLVAYSRAAAACLGE